MTSRGVGAHKTIRRLLLAVSVLAWAGAFTATHLPPGDVPDIHTSDKFLHLAGYTALASPLLLTMAAFGWSRRRRIAWMLAMLMAYGAFDELTQPFFRRDAELNDWFCDVAGTTLAVVVWELALALASAIRRRRQAGAKLRAYER
jgi:VanZ family protein